MNPDNNIEKSAYIKEEYDPQIYINKIRNIINEARQNGLRVEFNLEDNILEIENTVSKDERTLDFKEEFKYSSF